MPYDCVVVGAGPAGSATARDIASAGFRVLVVDKHRTIGEPALCSGLISPRTIALARVSRALVLNEIGGATVRSASGARLDLGGDRAYALAIDRTAFDRALADQAEAAGAHLLLDTKLVDIARDDGHLRLTIGENGTARQVTTNMLIGADGASSTVARWLGVRQRDGAVRAIAGEGWLPTSALDRAEVFVGGTVAPGWFGWIIPLGDGRVRIGTGNASHHRIPAHTLLKNLLAAFPARFKGLKLARVWSKAIPLYCPVQTYGHNVLLVGDAARQVKPTSGGGIYTGLVGARHCARLAVEAIEREDFSEAFLSRYEAAWKGELGGELEKGIDLRRAFLSLSDHEIDQLLAHFASPSLKRLIGQLGDIDTPSLIMEQLVRAAPVLRLFLHVPLRFPSRWAADLLRALAGSVACR